jgi:hypothetical protein
MGDSMSDELTREIFLVICSDEYRYLFIDNSEGGRYDLAISIAKEIKSIGSNDDKFHYSEALDWIDALEFWIRKQGLDVPTWSDMTRAGWHGRVTPEIEVFDS